MFVHDISSVKIVILFFYENMFCWFSQKLTDDINFFFVQKMSNNYPNTIPFWKWGVSGVSSLLKNCSVLYSEGGDGVILSMSKLQFFGILRNFKTFFQKLFFWNV